MTKIFRGSAITDDWVFGKGKSDYMRDDLAIAQDIKTKLRTFRGECFFDGSVGVRWFEVLGQKDVANIVAEVKSVILEVDGVIKITNVEFQLSESRNLVVRYWLDTVNSTGTSGSVEL
jgi:hypothetical protein